MLHDIFGGKPLFGKNIRSVLAHDDAVAVARDVEGEGTVLVCHSERGRAQRENGAQIVSAQLDAADRDGGDIVRVCLLYTSALKEQRDLLGGNGVALVAHGNKRFAV